MQPRFQTFLEENENGDRIEVKCELDWWRPLTASSLTSSIDVSVSGVFLNCFDFGRVGSQTVLNSCKDGVGDAD